VIEQRCCSDHARARAIVAVTSSGSGAQRQVGWFGAAAHVRVGEQAQEPGSA